MRKLHYKTHSVRPTLWMGEPFVQINFEEPTVVTTGTFRSTLIGLAKEAFVRWDRKVFVTLYVWVKSASALT